MEGLTKQKVSWPYDLR